MVNEMILRVDMARWARPQLTNRLLTTLTTNFQGIGTRGDAANPLHYDDDFDVQISVCFTVDPLLFAHARPDYR